MLANVARGGEIVGNPIEFLSELVDREMKMSCRLSFTSPISMRF